MRGLLVAGALFLAVLPIAILLGVGYLFADRQVHRDLDTSAYAAIVESARLVDRAAEELEGVTYLAARPCTDETVALLAGAALRSPRLREISVFGPDLTVTCSSVGPVRTPADPEVQRAATPEGVFLTVQESRQLGLRSVIVHLRLPNGSGVSGLIDPEEFLERIEGNALPGSGTIDLGLTDGTVIGRVGEGQGGVVTSQAESPKHPIVALAAVDYGFVIDRFLQSAPSFFIVGVLFAGLVGWLILLLANRQQPIDQELQTALRRNELEVHYQPIIDLELNRCVGAEALIRWRHPSRGLVRPDLFVPLAEETGLIVPITRWLIGRVKTDLAAAFPDGDMNISVNLVAEHFRSHVIVADVWDLLRDGAIQPQQLTFEATERQIIQDGDRAAEVMRALHRLGCSLAIDDFGTGQSGLAALHRFRVDTLKIDRLFVDTIGTDALSRPILDAIIDLAKKLDLSLTAEGVEQAHQVAYLRERNVRYAQGYYFAHPMPLADLVRFVQTYNQAEAPLPESLPATTT